MSVLWGCHLREQTPITGWRDGNEMIRKEIFESIRWLAYKTVIPDKEIGKSLPKLAKNQDVLIATFAANPTAKIKWTDAKVPDPQAARIRAGFRGRSSRSSGEAPSPWHSRT